MISNTDSHNSQLVWRYYACLYGRIFFKNSGNNIFWDIWLSNIGIHSVASGGGSVAHSKIMSVIDWNGSVNSINICEISDEK